MKKYFINNKYPMMANWLITYRIGEMYYVKNVFTDTIFELDRETYRFLVNLNGKREPYKLARSIGVDAEEVMSCFTMNNLIRRGGRTLIANEGTILYTIYIPGKNISKSIIPRVYNFVLLMSWLPVSVYGIYKIVFTTYEIKGNYFHAIYGFVLALSIGMILHEISHVMACLAYGGRFLEAGIRCEKFSLGAYCLIYKLEITSRLKRVQINAAGIECNLYLVGLFFVLCTQIECASVCFFCAAIFNIMLAMCNLIPLTSGSDGYSIVKEILRKEGENFE